LSPESGNRSKTLKGAIATLKINTKGKILSSETPFFVFQYNPEMITRTISFGKSEEESQVERKKADANSITEVINFHLEFDMIDQIEQSNQHKNYLEKGLHPTLAALESIMHSQAQAKNSSGHIILFLFGPNRMLPVWIDSIKVLEESFDQNLNPIRVRIELNMRMRDLSELKPNSLKYDIYSKHFDNRRLLTQHYAENTPNPELFGQDFRTALKNLTGEKPNSKNTQL
jgi:hypothetical protein